MQFLFFRANAVCPYDDGTNPMLHKILKAWGDRVGKDLWKELVDAQPIQYR